MVADKSLAGAVSLNILEINRLLNETALVVSEEKWLLQ